MSRRGGTRDYKLNDVLLVKEHIHYAFPWHHYDDVITDTKLYIMS